jgi:hypothetical protein
MTITFHPKRLLATVAFLIAFGSALSVATDVRRGVAVGALAVLVYLLVEVFAVVNPAAWWQHRRSLRP